MLQCIIGMQDAIQSNYTNGSCAADLCRLPLFEQSKIEIFHFVMRYKLCWNWGLVQQSRGKVSANIIHDHFLFIEFTF